eukprot:3616562-Rhodomonas_salina.3
MARGAISYALKVPPKLVLKTHVPSVTWKRRSVGHTIPGHVYSAICLRAREAILVLSYSVCQYQRMGEGQRKR